MFVNVTKDNVLVDEDSFETHQGEYNVTNCYFTFSEEFDSLIKIACFTINSTNETYKIDIVDNECSIPAEVLEKEFETITLGVYGYSVDENDNLELRYSPTPFEFCVERGSYKEGGETPEIITPTQYELYSQKLQEGLDEVDDKIEEMDAAIERTNNLDIEAEKEGKTTTITITDKDGEPHETLIEDGQDGTSLENMKIENKDLIVTYGGSDDNLGQVAPSIQVGTTSTGTPDTSASVVNVGTDLNPIFNFTIPQGKPGSIKFEIVQQLPTEDIKEDTIYLVPYAVVTVEELPSTGALHTIYIVSSTNKRYVYESSQWVEIASDNRYIEYIYVNGSWEELGGINVDIDLNDYYTKTETNTLLNTKQPLIDNDHKLPYSLISGTPDLTDYVKNTDYATSSTGGVVKISSSFGTYLDNGTLKASAKTYADYPNLSSGCFISKGTLDNVLTAKIGDIQTLLDNLNTGSGV